jgi:hypothetical protein
MAPDVIMLVEGLANIYGSPFGASYSLFGSLLKKQIIPLINGKRTVNDHKRLVNHGRGQITKDILE